MRIVEYVFYALSIVAGIYYTIWLLRHYEETKISIINGLSISGIGIIVSVLIFHFIL